MRWLTSPVRTLLEIVNADHTAEKASTKNYSLLRMLAYIPEDL